MEFHKLENLIKGIKLLNKKKNQLKHYASFAHFNQSLICIKGKDCNFVNKK